MADENNQELLSATEYSIVGASIFEKMAEYGNGYKYNYQTLEGDECIGLINLPGGKYLSRDIIGGYTAQLPFQIMYQTKATTNKELLTAEQVITAIGEYLETKPYPTLDGGRTITDIKCDGIPYRAQADNSASVIFALTGSVKYEK